MPADSEEIDVFIAALEANFGTTVSEIPDYFVEKAYDSNFCEYEEADGAVDVTTYRAEGFSIALKNVMESLEVLVEKGTEAPIFNQMAERSVPVKKIVTLAWIAIEEALANDQDQFVRKNGIYATRMYMLLSCLNGASAFEIFSKFLFVRSIEQVRQVMAEKLDAHRKRLLSFAIDGIFALLGHVSLAAEDGVLAVALLVRDAIRVDLSDDTRVDSVASLEGFADVRRISEKSFAILHRLLDDRHVSGRNTVMGKVLLNRLMCYGSQDEVLPQIQKISAPMLLYRDRVIAFLTKRAEGGQPAELKMIFDLVKNLFRCPDRSDYKDKVTESAMGLLHLLPAAYHVKFVEFVDLAYCQPDLGSMRSFTVEILPQFIKAFDLSAPIENLIEEEVGEEEDSGAEAPREEVEKAENEGSEDEEEVQRRSKKKAQKTREAQRKERSELDPVSTPVQILVEAVYDKSSSIRAKALAHLGSLFGIPEKFALIEKICSGAFDEAKLRQKSVPGQKYPTPLLLIVLQAGDDERVAVRKAAIGVLAKLFNHLLEEDHVRYTLREMTDLTRDCAIAVRKEAAEKLTEVFRNHEDVEIVRRSWLDSIMPLLVDREQSVQQLAAKIVMEIIFAQLSSAVPSDYVWMLLADIEKDFNVRRLLYRSMRALHEQSLLPQSLVTVVSRYAQEEDKRAPVWLLLSFLSKIFTVPPQMAFSYWFQLDVEAHATMVPTYVCNILVETHKKLSETQKNQLKADLKSRIIRFDVQAKNVPAVFYLYAKLNDAVGEEARGQQQFGSFCQSLGKRVAGMICEVVYGRPMKELPFNDGPLDSQTLVSDATTSRPATAIPNVRPEDVSENKVVTMLQVVGECVQYEPKTCTDKLAKIFKYIFASDYALHTDDEEEIDLRANLVMSEVAEEVPLGSQPITQRSQAVEKFWQDHKLLQNVTSKRVRAVCAINMCRICLQHEKLAKECIPVFARELRNNRDHIIRNNLIVGISDLCVRYTLMVDRYVTVMALCLTDSSVFVRQQTITLLTILIKEQFLKCEGQILYKLIAALNDDHKDIRDYLYFCLVEVLLAQFPSMFSNHFLECVFYFNGADHGHQASLEGQENSKKHEYEHMRSNIQGAANMVKRMRLYKFMLSMMTDAQRFAIWVRLVFEVANKISQGTMDYKKKVYENILIDTLNLMCCDEIKMHSVIKKKESEGGEGSEEAPSEEIPGDKAISKLTAFFRSRVGELILPGMLELRAFLLEKRSPILKLVMNALMELTKDYEEQLDSFFASNRQAKAELEWDLRTAKEAQEEDRRVQEMAQAQKENRAVSVVPNTSMARAPCTPDKRTTRSASAMKMGTVPRSMRRKSNIFEKSASEKSMIYDERAEENPLAEYRAPCDYRDNDVDPPSRASILRSPFRSQNESPMSSRLVDSPGPRSCGVCL
ncbi:hypothetical protein L596_012978 [Steinernema carpocapsae]|uniref:Condensin complex subunit 1 C-terminal domain-containing protein n=1 Tax=Steinernema carpocapsae TaxID=34508 RepID=A0A4U5NZA6_STECR|nr:hypothetical protein L596_012978 [Steinernema carpocapsae]